MCVCVCVSVNSLLLLSILVENTSKVMKYWICTGTVFHTSAYNPNGLVCVWCADPIILVFVPGVEYGFLCVYKVM